MKLLTKYNGVDVVNARDLHTYLEIENYQYWIKSRVKKHNLIENKDYFFHKVNVTHSAGGSVRKEYELLPNIAIFILSLEKSSRDKWMSAYYLITQDEKNYKSNKTMHIEFPEDVNVNHAISSKVIGKETAGNSNIFSSNSTVELRASYENPMREKIQKAIVPTQKVGETFIELIDTVRSALEIATRLSKMVPVDEAKEKLNALEQKKQEAFIAFEQSVKKDNLLVRDFSKILMSYNVLIKPLQLFEWLRFHKYLMKDNTPYSQYVQSGYFSLTTHSVLMNGSVVIRTTTRITNSGQLYLFKKLLNKFFNG